VSRRRASRSGHPLTDQEDVARLISQAQSAGAAGRSMNGHARHRHRRRRHRHDDRRDDEDVQKFGGMEALDKPYMKIGFAG
jgi:magnesium transporter